MAVYDNSRFINTNLEERDGVSKLGFYTRNSFNMENATAYTWKEGDTLDGVAYNNYGISEFRWAILDANPQYRSEFDIEPGDTYVTLTYDRFGEYVSVQVPLTGEDVP